MNERHLLTGTARVIAAEGLLLPTGLVTAAYLTRAFGPSDYGLFTLAATIVAWIEWTITSVFARATFKFVAESSDWKPIGSTVLRLHLFLSLIAAGLLWLLAPSIANALREPSLSLYLRIFTIDIPLFATAHAHRNILIGLGSFKERAYSSAGRWIARMVLIILFVQAGWSVQGAIAGSILASFVELLIGRIYIRPSLFNSSSPPVSKFWDYALPLFLFALCMRVYEKLDLVSLKLLGASAATAGYYGAAQNLSIVLNIFAMSFSPLLLSTVTSQLTSGNFEKARETGRNSLRLVIGLLPIAAVFAGTASNVVPLIFGSEFVEAALLFAILIFSSWSLAVLSVTTAVLTAAGRPQLTFWLATSMLPLSIAGYVLVTRGAAFAELIALVNAFVAFAGAIACIVALYMVWEIFPPFRTVIRSILIAVAIGAIAYYWPASGIPAVVFKIMILTLSIVPAFVLLGEFGLRDLFSFTFSADGSR